jgi:hypothetical protein
LLQLVINGKLTVYDSEVERLSVPCLSVLPPGHYKIGFTRRHAPRSRSEGSGRMSVTDLNSRDVQALSDDPRCTPYQGGLSILGFRGDIGGLADLERCSIAGGSVIDSGTATANYQPLTPHSAGVRVHNSHILQIMDYLEPRLRCEQLVILSIVGD